MTAEAVRAALAQVVDPEIRRPITELDMVRDVTVTDAVAHVDLRLTIVGCPAADTIERDVRAAVLAVPGIASLDLDIGVMTPAEREALTTRLRGTKRQQFGPDSLTRVFAVTSGKGGVGKSTVTANLAVALAARGLRVGLIDADVFGYSILGILGLAPDGVSVKPTQVGDMILPPVAHGVKVISIGMFVDGSTAVSWRGPLLHRTMQQFLTDVFFGDLDVLLLDLPPGTGDVAISLGQHLPGGEVLVVTTPQEAAAEVAERAGTMASMMHQRVVGVVENMSYLPCPHCTPEGKEHRLELFGAGGGDRVAETLSRRFGYDVPVLGRIPLDTALREGGDAGTPIVESDPGSPAAVVLHQIAAGLAGRGRGPAGMQLGLTPAGRL